MSSEKLISILMPAYNCENYIKQAIDSILNQTYSHFELLIADDCSTDRTKAIIDSYNDERIKRFHNEVNLGYLKASNKLFAQCKGEYISFQDADDFSDPNRFDKLTAFLNLHPETFCIGSNIKKINITGNEFAYSNYPLEDKDIRDKFDKYMVVMTGSALMFSKKIVDKIGVYNEYFDRIGSEDTYLYSLILNNFKVANLPDNLYYYRANPSSIGFTHKNPKASVGHQIVIFFYKNRSRNKPDYIKSNQWQKADRCAGYLLAINEMKRSKMKAIFSFIKMSFIAPYLFSSFFREFGSNLRSQIN